MHGHHCHGDVAHGRESGAKPIRGRLRQDFGRGLRIRLRQPPVRVLQRLEERALIERKASPDDRRRSLVWLTAAGQKVNAMRAGTVEAALRRAMNKLSTENLAAAEAVLTVFASELRREG